MLKAKRNYPGRTQDNVLTEENAVNETFEEDFGLIKLNYTDDTSSQDNEAQRGQKSGWRVVTLTLIDPEGNKMTISGASTRPIVNLLIKLSH